MTAFKLAAIPRKLHCLALTLAMSSSSVFALGRNVPYETFATPNAVDQVIVCGQWPAPRAPDQSPRRYDGVYRLIHASQYGQSFLYIQWMQYLENGDRMVHHTLSMDELNNDHAEIELSALQCKSNAKGITITAKAASGHDDQLKRITITLGHALGEYRLQQHRKP